MAGFDLDKMLNSALHAQPIAAAPKGLYGKIYARLVVADLVKQERDWRRHAVALALLGSFCIACGAISLWMCSAIFASVAFYLPGIMGWYDYAVNSVIDDIAVLLVAGAMIAVIPVLAVTVGFLFPRRHLAD